MIDLPYRTDEDGNVYPEPAVPAQSAPTPRHQPSCSCTYRVQQATTIRMEDKRCPVHCKPIPPTSAPKYVGAAYNALMEEETKESLVRMVLTDFNEITELKRQLAEAQRLLSALYEHDSVETVEEVGMYIRASEKGESK